MSIDALHELHDVSVLFPSVEAARDAWSKVFKTPGQTTELNAPGLNGLAMRVETSISREALDLRLVEADESQPFDTGQAYIGMRIGLAMQFDVRSHQPTYPDTWAKGGRMRQASLLITDLLALGGHAVVLHKAGAVVKSTSLFRFELGDLRDLKICPWLAWIDVVVSQTGEGLEARTYGMPHYFGAPNVKASAPGSDAWSIEAIVQATKFISGVFATSSEDINKPRSHFDVPLWFTLDRARPEVSKKAVTRAWNAALDRENSTMLLLTSDEVGEKLPSILWDRALTEPDALPFETYARCVADILSHRLARWNLRRVDEPRYDGAGLPPVRVISYANRTLEMHVTAGFGAVRAPSGTDELGTAHAELAMLAPPGDTAMVENALLGFGSLALQTTAPGGLKDFDHLAASANGWGYLIVPLEDIAVSASRPVALRMLVPITRDEIEALKQGANRKAFYETACPDLDAVALRWARMREA